MKKVCVFKVFAVGIWWYVYEVTLSEVNTTKMFRVYKGRRWLCHIAFYDVRYAIEGCLGAAIGCTVRLDGEICL